MNVCTAFGLIDAISEIMEIPLLLIDGNGNPIYRSRYYFQSDLTGKAADGLRAELVAACALQPEGVASFISVFNMDAAVASVNNLGDDVYLVAGYFIRPDKEKLLLQHFGTELGEELLAKNLLPRWNSRTDAFLHLVSVTAQVFCRHRFLEQLLQLDSALGMKEDLQSKAYWQGVLS
ncbi:MAG: hypothetical protein SCM57_11755, partial [Bacillota bacterium]|nr:hypothetical protein [Bacillota bacterium]